MAAPPGDRQAAAGREPAAFEVEHTTSIYSGIVRMLDLAASTGNAVRGLYLVAPDAREDDVRRQLLRPAFRRIGEQMLSLGSGAMARRGSD